MENKVVKIGNVEMYEWEAKRCYEENKYIVCYTTVWKVNKTPQGKYVGERVYKLWRKYGEVGLTRRGRYYVTDKAGFLRIKLMG